MKKRVKVTLPNKLPKAVYGMTVKGKINNMDGSQNTRGSLMYGDDNVPATNVNRTLKPTERENATLEAEKGETVVTNLAQTGIPEFYTIGGKRHHSGGTPLNLPPDSFIFSRDRKLMVKDKDILEQFGKTVTKKGKKKYSFADLSKSFDNGMYRQILADPTSDKHQIDTAQMMIKNYNLKLGALALVQESRKGFPDGIPGISMPYLEHTGMDPSKFELPKMNMGGQAPMMPQGMPQGMPMGRYGMPVFAPGGPNNNNNVVPRAAVDLSTKPIYSDYDFQGVTGWDQLDDYYNRLSDVAGADNRVNRNKFYEAWNRTPQSANAKMYQVEGTNNWNRLKHVNTATPRNAGPGIQFFHSTPGNEIPYGSQTPVNRYGGIPNFAPGGPFEEAVVAEDVQPLYPKEMFANVSTHQQALDLLKGQVQASGTMATDEQQLKLSQTADQGYFDALKEATGLEFTHTSDDGSDKWSPVNKPYVQPGPAPSDKPFDAGFKLVDGKLFQKQQGKVTGKEHWQASNPVMAAKYAKKYGTDDMTAKELQAAITNNPEAFVNSFGQPAQDAKLAAITLKKLGGDSNVPMFAPGGVNEVDYTTLADTYGSPKEQALLEQAYTQDYIDQPGYGWNQNSNTRRVKVSYGSEPQTSNRATSVQNVPKNARKWDMTAEGYDEASVQPGDYVKKTDGKWYETNTVTRKTTPYEGELDERLGDLGEAYGRLETRLLGNEKLQNALYKKYKTNMAKAKPRNNLSEADLEAARGLSKKQVIDNFLRAQKQIMAVQAKGPLENADAWDKDLGHYSKAMTDMKFTPMSAAETAAFQGAYISMQNLRDADPEFRKELNDFVISSKTRKGKGDEPGGGTGRSTISDIDGWFGNTTIGESMLYAPKDTELDMKEVEWSKIKNTPEMKHMRNQYGAQKTPFWTEDVVNLGFAAKNLFGIRKEQPWMAKARMAIPRPTFMTPDQQIQNILGAQAKGIRGASNIGSPQAYAATIASIQANAMQNVANSIGNVHDMNVKISNMFEDKRIGIINNARIRDAQLATSLHDKNAVLNQQFRNSKNQAWDTVRRMGNNMWTNRGKTQNLNTFNDQYFINPQTGFKHFYNPRELTAKNSQQPTLAARINQLREDVPGLTADKAATILARQKGYQAPSPSGQMGIDPPEMAPGYPGGVPQGYYSQG